MKKIGKNVVTAIISAVLVITVVHTGKAVGLEPGSSQDPLVSKSYVDKRIDEVIRLIGSNPGNGNKDAGDSNEILKTMDEKIKQLQEQIDYLDQTPKSTYEIVNVSKGKKLIGAQGTEIILRAGKGTAIASSGGGLQDMTEGVDVNQGEAISRYHLLIIPRDDGRGIATAVDTVFMVRGDYQVIQ